MNPAGEINECLLEGGGRLWLDPRPGVGLVAVRIGFPRFGGR